MISHSYVWEKVMNAVSCLCSGDDSFEKRLWDANTNALMRLTHREGAFLNQIPGDVAADLEWLLKFCKEQFHGDRHEIARIGDLDRKKAVDTLVSILVRT